MDTENMELLMKEPSPKFIYFYRGDKKERDGQVSQFATHLQNGLKVQPILLDMKTDGEAFLELLR